MRLIVPVVLVLVAGFFGYDYMTKNGGGLSGSETASGPSGSSGSSSLLSGFFGGSSSRSAPAVSKGAVSSNPFVKRETPPEPEDAPPEPEDAPPEPEDAPPKPEDAPWIHDTSGEVDTFESFTTESIEANGNDVEASRSTALDPGNLHDPDVISEERIDHEPESVR